LGVDVMNQTRSKNEPTSPPLGEEAEMNTATADETIVNAVRRELEWDPKVNANSLGVTAVDGSIALIGTVPSHGEKLAAVKAAERVYGVRTVAAKITVELPDASVVGDEEIAETIARQLQSNTAVPETVKADVEKGYVTLRGTVEWAYQREAAERPISLVRGIYHVANLISVEPRLTLAADLRARVHEAIGRMADLDARSIGVAEKDGTVHLHGSVHSLAERRIAEHAAAGAPGVRAVNNELVVTP
jgi:osmotically-inducible protein OsmY